MALSVDHGKALIAEFCALYPSAYQIQYKVRATQEEAFHKSATVERLGRILGAYFPAQRIAAFATSNFHSIDKFKRTIRHEVLGHFGINTFTSENKRKLLVALSKARDQPGLSTLYKKADRLYNHKSELEKAEEIFCFTCENILPQQHIDKLRGQQVFHEVVLERIRPMQINDLKDIALMVAKGLQDRTRSLQIVPATDKEQFCSKDLPDLAEIKKGAVEAARARRQAQPAMLHEQITPTKPLAEKLQMIKDQIQDEENSR